ncbi:MAG: GntR family transcriptional regulator [Pseudomonadota bacterium]
MHLRSTQVLDALRDEILLGQYRPGERLPSERELAARFETSRGAVREALKKLEQLGIAAIAPGGVRVVAVEEATLDVMGPLLDLHAVPDAILVDQAIQVLTLLISESARNFVLVASEAAFAEADDLIDSILEADPHSHECIDRRMSLGRHFMSTCGNLPMRLIANGLRINFGEKVRARGFIPQPEPNAVRAGMLKVKEALRARDADGAARAMREVMELNRVAMREALEAAGATRCGLDLIPTAPSKGLKK